ncbi:MAG: DUF192 domain-containing protein [Xanthomonadales bacterium]|nr:DUF192 domain-containing protein [Xanthomonadales bacterium]
MRATAIFFPILALLLAACSAAGPRVELAGKTYRVEIADDPRERALGMMFREEMDPDTGMFFIFKEEAPRSFHMKNCKIHLDILFFDADFRLINAHHNVPPCYTRRCPGYPSEAPAKYVLELSGGQARALPLEPGIRLRFDP